MNLDYSNLANEIITALDKNKHWVLATAAQNRVTARTMSIVNEGLTIFFQTDQTFDKYQQIQENPQVAICFSNIQIEGVAQNLGHPLTDANRFFAALYQKFHPSSYAQYSHLANEVAIQVNPTRIIVWNYIDGKPCRDYLDTQAKTATREFYRSEN